MSKLVTSIPEDITYDKLKEIAEFIAPIHEESIRRIAIKVSKGVDKERMYWHMARVVPIDTYHYLYEMMDLIKEQRSLIMDADGVLTMSHEIGQIKMALERLEISESEVSMSIKEVLDHGKMLQQLSESIKSIVASALELIQGCSTILLDRKKIEEEQLEKNEQKDC